MRAPGRWGVTLLLCFLPTTSEPPGIRTLVPGPTMPRIRVAASEMTSGLCRILGEDDSIHSESVKCLGLYQLLDLSPAGLKCIVFG